MVDRRVLSLIYLELELILLTCDLLKRGEELSDLLQHTIEGMHD